MYEVERRIDLFLDAQDVHNVRLESYLRDLATHDEKEKYHRNGSKL